MTRYGIVPLVLSAFSIPAVAQTIACVSPVGQQTKTCSLSALNGSCTVTINRKNPVVSVEHLHPEKCGFDDPDREHIAF